MLLGLLLHSLYTFLAFVIVYAFHLAIERVPFWLQRLFQWIGGGDAGEHVAEEPVGALVAKAVAYAVLVGGGICCISFVWMETVKFFKQLRKPTTHG